MENPMKMDDLEVSLFLETPILVYKDPLYTNLPFGIGKPSTLTLRYTPEVKRKRKLTPQKLQVAWT